MPAENIIIGSIIILINAIPLLTKRYKIIPLTAIISVLLYFISTLI